MTVTEKSIFTIVNSVGTGCGAAQVLGNSRPPQPPRVSEGQRDIRKPGRFRSATPNSSGLTPAVGVITPTAGVSPELFGVADLKRPGFRMSLCPSLTRGGCGGR